MRVDIWSDLVCPWCYIGKRRFESAMAAFEGSPDVEVVHHSYQLNPSAPRDRTSSRQEMLMAKYGWSEAQMHATDARMAQIAADEGLDYRLEGTVTGNTRDAHQLLHLARGHGRQDAMLERLYRAYFTEQRSIFDVDSLVELADEVGLGADEARAALVEERYGTAVDEDLAVATRIGISGVPFFVFDMKYGVSGAQQPAVFLEALSRVAGRSA